MDENTLKKLEICFEHLADDKTNEVNLLYLKEQPENYVLFWACIGRLLWLADRKWHYSILELAGKFKDCFGGKPEPTVTERMNSNDDRITISRYDII